MKAAIESDRAVFEAEVSSLRRECSQLRLSANDMSLDEEMGRLREALSASQHANVARQEEASRLRRTLEQLEQARQSDASAASAALAAAEAKLAHVNLNLRTALQQRSDAESATQAAVAECAGLREALSEQQKAAEHAKSETAEKQRELAEVRAQRRNNERICAH